jgi:3-oxoacyl-[acyl-carrier-protein] synthase III
MTEIRSVIKGYGAYVPKNKLDNHALPATLDTSDEWIRTRTGITQRYLADKGEVTSDLACHAAQAALKNAGIDAQEIDLIVLATATPDESFPASATRVQQKLGITHAAAFDVNAACSGFVYALHITDALLKTGAYRHALVIGAETMSRVVDWEDRRTAILFGDGAGACVLSATKNTQQGIICSMIASDGAYADILATNGGVSSTQTAGTLFMDGQEVFRHAVAKMSLAVEQCAEQAGLNVADIDVLVPHQANARILQACAKKLNLSDDKVIMTVDQHANTSSASIPLALAYGASCGKLKKDSLLMLTALGAGLTWGACLIRL